MNKFDDERALLAPYNKCHDLAVDIESRLSDYDYYVCEDMRDLCAEYLDAYRVYEKFCKLREDKRKETTWLCLYWCSKESALSEDAVDEILNGVEIAVTKKELVKAKARGEAWAFGVYNTVHCRGRNYYLMRKKSENNRRSSRGK